MLKIVTWCHLPSLSRYCQRFYLLPIECTWDFCHINHAVKVRLSGGALSNITGLIIAPFKHYPQ